MRRDPTLWLGALLMVCLSATAALAQTTGSINGSVADNTGAMLPGVTVTATSPALMGVQTAVTNESGNYGSPRFRRDLHAHLRAVRLHQHQARRHRRQSRLHGDGQRAAAGGVAAGDGDRDGRVAGRRRDQHDRTFNLTQDMLQTLPNARDIWSVMGQSPGVRVSRIDVGGSRAGTQTGFEAFGYLRPGANPDRRCQHDGRHRQRRLLLRLRLVRRAAAGQRRQRRAGGDAGRAAERRDQVGRQQLQGTVYTDYQNENLQGANIDERLAAWALARAPARSTTTTSTATSAARSARQAVVLHVAAPAGQHRDGVGVPGRESRRLRPADEPAERHLQTELSAVAEQPHQPLHPVRAQAAARARRHVDALSLDGGQAGQRIVGGQRRVELDPRTEILLPHRGVVVRLQLPAGAVRAERRARDNLDRRVTEADRARRSPRARTTTRAPIAGAGSSTGTASSSRTTGWAAITRSRLGICRSASRTKRPTAASWMR